MNDFPPPDLPRSPLAAPPQSMEELTQGTSSLYRLFEAFIALREKNERQHKMFEQTLTKSRDTIQSSGFELVEWVDETAWVRQWFEDLGGRIAAGGTQATLPALLTDGPTRMLNFAVALTTGVVTVHRGSFILAP